jgi:hypothetical protein
MIRYIDKSDYTVRLEHTVTIRSTAGEEGRRPAPVLFASVHILDYHYYFNNTVACTQRNY